MTVDNTSVKNVTQLIFSPNIVLRSLSTLPSLLTPSISNNLLTFTMSDTIVNSFNIVQDPSNPLFTYNLSQNTLS
jgi:hypothetical protein